MFTTCLFCCFSSPERGSGDHGRGASVPDRRSDQLELHFGQEPPGLDPSLVHKRTAGEYEIGWQSLISRIKSGNTGCHNVTFVCDFFVIDFGENVQRPILAGLVFAICFILNNMVIFYYIFLDFLLICNGAFINLKSQK